MDGRRNEGSGFRKHVAIQPQQHHPIYSWFAWMAQLEFEFNPDKTSFVTEIAENKLLDFMQRNKDVKTDVLIQGIH